MSKLDLQELRAFGTEAHQVGAPRISIAEGGFLVTGDGLPQNTSPGKENAYHVGEQGSGEEAGPAAGARAGPPAEAAAADQAAHAVQRVLGETLKFGELLEYHPSAQVLRNSPNFALVGVSLGLFRTLPYRARVYLEVPLADPRSLGPRHDPLRRDGLVPDVRAWAYWDGGIQITSHHRNPDGSICACMPGEWVWGHHPLHEYVDLCTSWIGKVLHLQLVGWWPGPQHYGPRDRLIRNQPDEFCGCGERRFWRECHMETDLAFPMMRRDQEERLAHAAYFRELHRQGRDINPVLRA